jgi:small subunit ribosomal protein S3
MGQKTNPKGIRIGITSTWRSRWFNKKEYAKILQEDIRLRRMVMQRWKSAAISDVEIERSPGVVKLIISTSRPGVLIGRGGSGIEDIVKYVKGNFHTLSKNEVKVEIIEIKHFEENSSLVSQQIAEQLEKRMPFRRVLKSMLDTVSKNKNIKGVKIELAGRLDGSEMSRREWLSKGTIPLHTLRADIDFARATAKTTYGTIGVKVWLHRGEYIARNQSENNNDKR